MLIFHPNTLYVKTKSLFQEDKKEKELGNTPNLAFLNYSKIIFMRLVCVLRSSQSFVILSCPRFFFVDSLLAYIRCCVCKFWMRCTRI